MEVESSKALVPVTRKQKYRQQAESLRNDHGGLESIRETLGFSQRQMAELLLVDPSAWSRWIRNESKVPPHIYQSLDWYLKLQRTAMQPVKSDELRTEVMLKLEDMRQSMVSMEKEAMQEWMDTERRELLENFQKEAQLGAGWKMIMLLNLFGLVLIGIILI